MFVEGKSFIKYDFVRRMWCLRVEVCTFALRIWVQIQSGNRPNLNMMNSVSLRKFENDTLCTNFKISKNENCEEEKMHTDYTRSLCTALLFSLRFRADMSTLVNSSTLHTNTSSMSYRSPIDSISSTWQRPRVKR